MLLFTQDRILVCSMVLLSTLVLSSYSVTAVMLGYDFWLYMVINISV